MTAVPVIRAELLSCLPPAIVIAVASVIGGFIADAAEPVFTFIGGGAAVGAAVFSTFAFSFSDEPDYGHAAGEGTVAGALLGAALLLADALIGG